MREIKFRAWDTNKKGWKGLWIFRGGHSNAYDVSNDKIDILELNNRWGKEVVLQQYTGLKDKIGKEIYEGDIVETSDGDMRQIIYCHNSFEMRCVNGNRDSTSTVWYFTTEIVGNIHEHPHLLNSDKEVQVSNTTDDDSSNTV